MPDNNQPITDAALAELDRVYKQCETSWIAIGHDLHSTYPALRERMRLAEAERDHHQLLREELMEQVHELKDELHCALYCLELNGIADDGVREKLAARDARMKREGVIKWLEKNSDEWTAKDMRNEAKRLREEVL